MLKVKEGIKLEELEKYGFEKSTLVNIKCYKKSRGIERIWVYEDDRTVYISQATKLLESLYDLITAGIVVKE